MRQFHDVFYEEAAEHLERFESLLRSVEPGRPASGKVDELFRYAHSVKGGSATFGFQEAARLARGVEALLDAVRKGRVGLEAEVIDACLAAAGQLRRQLAARRAGAGLKGGAAPEALMRRLQALAEGAAAWAGRRPVPDAPCGAEAGGAAVERMTALVEDLARAWSAVRAAALGAAPPAADALAAGLSQVEQGIAVLQESLAALRLPAPAGALDEEEADPALGLCGFHSPARCKSSKISPFRRTHGQPLPKAARGAGFVAEWEEFWK